MRDRNAFAGPYLDRVGHLRADPAWFASALSDPRSRAVPLWNSRSLVTGADTPGSLRAAFLALGEIPESCRNPEELMLLGRFGETPIFAVEVEGAEAPQMPDGTRFEELRSVAPLLPAEQAGLLSYARALVIWRRTHRYCGRCGTRTVAAKSGHVLVCTNPTCRHEQFPRIDPAIIVLIADGERALLGRQASWPVGRYSTIAGFVEPGESLEDAVAREIDEETGVRVDEIHYHSSQPWPFPSSLMLGFSARARSSEIHLRDRELEDARWFTRAEIRDALTGSGIPLLPPPLSISFRLIEQWFDAGTERPLRSLGTPGAWER